MKGMMPYPTSKHLLFFFTILVCLSNSLFSQEGINQLNASGKKQGYWKKHYPDGRLRYEGYFENDIPKGEFKHYHANGKIKAIIRHAGDGIRAEAELYNEEGQLTARGSYLKEQKDGQWLFLAPGNNKIIAVEQWKKGKPHGIWKIYFNNDTTLSEYWSYVDGKKHGTWRQFFKDGSQRLEAFYRNDELNGNYKVFYPNGNIRLEGNYNNGLRSGEWKYFTEDGQLKRREWYEIGKMVKEEVLIPDSEETDTPLDPSLDPEKSRENLY